MTFKFFHKEEQEYINWALLRNEQIIHYWNDGLDQNLLTARIIAWTGELHRQSTRWEFKSFYGTMEQFFRNRLSIPAIRSIEGDEVFYHKSENDDNFPEMRNFRANVQYTIYYYEFI